MFTDKEVFLDEMEMNCADANAGERAFICCSFDFVTSQLCGKKSPLPLTGGVIQYIACLTRKDARFGSPSFRMDCAASR